MGSRRPPSWNCVPADDTHPNPLPVFCPDAATCFDSDHYPTLDPAKLAKGKVKPAEHLFDCPRWHLCLDTEAAGPENE
jgi:CRISPR-associated protein Csb2